MTAIVDAAGFSDISFVDVREPLYYGPDVAAAYEFVTGMRHAKDLLAELSEEAAERARQRLRGVLAEHDTGNGVHVGGRAWIVTARRG